MRLKNERVLITGGAGGLGSLLSERLTKAGADITILDRAPPAQSGAPTITGDLSSIDDLQRLAQDISKQDWDILINLAGVQHFGPFEAQSAASMARTYMVNLVAPAILTQAVLPGMRKRRHGRIVNIGSIFGSINFAHFASYSSSKAGLHGLSQALRRELAGTGVKVIYVAPRAVKTPLNSEQVYAFAKITHMNMDEPARVARRIVTAIKRCERETFLGFPEAFYVRLNGLAPAIVDGALSANDKRAAELFRN
jgi:short-subunit dehydrogenase